MTDNQLIFVCERSPGFARIAAAVANARSTDETTADGGPIRAAGFVHKRVADAGRRVGCEIETGRVEPVDVAALREADRVVAIGCVPDWVIDLPHADHWDGDFPTAADPNTIQDAVEQIENLVDRLLVETTAVDATTPNSGQSVGD